MSFGESGLLRSIHKLNPNSEDIELTTTADLRRHTRIDTFILAEASNDKGAMTIALISDISFSGLRLEGNREMVDILFPKANRDNKHIPVPVRICFELPGHTNLTATAQVLSGATYTRRSDKDTYQVGMQFIDIESGLSELADYLSSRGAI